MTFGQWLSFRGRIGRKTFWLGYVVPMLAAAIVANILDAALGLVPPLGADAMPAEASTQVGPIGSVVSLLSLWPGLAGTIKRLHDRDRSGWWIGGFYLVSIAGGFIAGFAAAIGIAQGGPMVPGGSIIALLVFGVLILAYAIWLLVETGFLRGTPGPNRFGPDPLLGGQGGPHWQQQGWQQPGAWPQQPPQQWQPQPPPGWQPPPQQWWQATPPQGGWQAPPQGGYPPAGPGQPPPGYGQPPPGYGEPPRGSVPPIRRD